MIAIIDYGVGNLFSAEKAFAALGADGESIISGLSHVDRGYFGFERDLALLGADAVRTRKSGGSV